MKRALPAATLLGAALIAVTLSSPDVLAAELLGRLFFTPAQRSALDAGKRIGEPQATRAPAPRGPRELKLDGVVTRSDGESMVWVNGRSLGSEPRPGVSATVAGSDPATAQIRLRGVRDPVRLRVGQRVDAVTGRVSEAYEDTASPQAGPFLRLEDAPAAPPPEAAAAKRGRD